jgi:hypothetical protein
MPGAVVMADLLGVVYLASKVNPVKHDVKILFGKESHAD